MAARIALAFLVALLAAAAAPAQTWPSKPVRYVVPFPPAGATDILARIIAERISGPLGQPIVIENRPGVAGNVGTEMVARAPADGYTILQATAAQAISETLYTKRTFRFDHEHALPRAARPAHDAGSRDPGLRGDGVVRHHAPQRRAEGRRPAHQRRSEQGARSGRYERKALAAGRDRDRLVPGAVRRLHPRRSGEMGQGGKRLPAPRSNRNRTPLPGLNHLEQPCGPHSAADAHRHHDVFRAPAPAFYERVTRKPRAGGPVGMAHRDGYAVDVQPAVGDAQTIGAIDQ